MVIKKCRYTYISYCIMCVFICVFFFYFFVLLFFFFFFFFFLYSFPVLPLKNRKRLKDFGILKIITLTLLWTIVTVWFPISQAYYTQVSFLLIFLRRFIFMFVLCLVFDIRDTEIDSKENIRTIPVMAGIKKAYLICYILLGVFVGLSFVQYFITPEAAILNAM